ncbi:MAG: SirB1 family protein [Janthinobacterium lividum]
MSVGAAEALDAIGQLPDDEIDLADAALQLARGGSTGEAWEAARAVLTQLARDAAALRAEVDEGDLPGQAEALAELLSDRWHFAGDRATYDDPANADLIRVLERRRGLPVALGIVWLHCAKAAGWRAHGVDFPGHFLVALSGGRGVAGRGPVRAGQSGQQMVLDVFAGGVALDVRELRALLKQVEGGRAELRPGLLRPMSQRAILLRLQNNVKQRRHEAGDGAGALDCLGDMMRIAPDEARLWREAGRLNQREDRVAAALHCFERFLTLVPQGADAARVRLEVEELRTRLN